MNFERKTAMSTTVDQQTAAWLAQIADMTGAKNRSDAFRLVVREAAVKRGLVAPAAQAERAAARIEQR